MIDDDRRCMGDQTGKDHYLQEDTSSPTREQLNYTNMILSRLQVLRSIGCLNNPAWTGIFGELSSQIRRILIKNIKHGQILLSQLK